MATQNGFDDLIVEKDGEPVAYSLDHLEGLEIEIPDFQFEDGRVCNVIVYVRPTNHVYSRALEDTDDYQALKQTGELLLKYEHHQDNPQQAKRDPEGNLKVDSDKRVFCTEKYDYSKILPDFISLLNEAPKQMSVLPNNGDVRTCLSALFELPEDVYEEGDCYLVFFTLHKKSSTTVHMVIETAFVVGKTHAKALLLTDT